MFEYPSSEILLTSLSSILYELFFWKLLRSSANVVILQLEYLLTGNFVWCTRFTAHFQIGRDSGVAVGRYSDIVREAVKKQDLSKCPKFQLEIWGPNLGPGGGGGVLRSLQFFKCMNDKKYLKLTDWKLFTLTYSNTKYASLRLILINGLAAARIILWAWFWMASQARVAFQNAY